MSAHNELSGSQYAPLSEAIRATFRLSQFDRMLLERLGINREDAALGDDYQDIVFRVIDAANRAGWVYCLVNAARAERPNHPVFVEYARLLGIGMQGLPDKTNLERIIKTTNAMLDVAIFRSRLGEIEGRVCRIDIGGSGEGTGFLVGPSAVLTNYHVIEGPFEKKHKLEHVTCRFDYKVREDGMITDSGAVYSVTEILSHTPYDPVEWTTMSAQPDPDKLDYALLYLGGEPGNHPIGKTTSEPGAQARGWIKMSMPDPKNYSPRSPIFIVQHPSTRPLKIALDTEGVIGLNGNGTRVRYTTNTEPGSSGSPCFNQNWELIALHNSGDQHSTPQWNQGIPTGLIFRRLQEIGFEHVLG